MFPGQRITSSSSGIPEQVLVSPHCQSPSVLRTPRVDLIIWTRHPHKNTIQALSWSPNGNLVASASRDQSVRVFDIRAMKEFRVLKGHKKEVCCTLLGPAFSHPFSHNPQLLIQLSHGIQSIQSLSRGVLKVLSSTGTFPPPHPRRPLTQPRLLHFHLPLSPPSLSLHLHPERTFRRHMTPMSGLSPIIPLVTFS